ncbi:MAG: DNA polymerase IV [Paracoccus sp. (in: a-proteobacteria)]|uniref:DNA polymerase IV n=1 Tax=Paracoccus sp. TaxID=267 RepID=UPI0026DFF021|nr:DNA polymerase IV [Paracoccus sp. (in: a-proteobacteria)]MDO5631741.1 DNA polymerase IV [Paracoccus sp. (in: a-proteobacteria)]
MTAGPDNPASPAERIRKIIHIDMDAFYASVEQRDNPDLRGRPVAVGGASRRGVVAAASYEARTFGVRSAMPSVTALRRCPDLIFVRPRFEVYRAISQQIRAIFARFTPLIEPLSLDEAYLDVTDHLPPGSSATAIARDIRALIRAETSLTASAGVSYNKFLAKLASDRNKPDGLCVITPSEGPEFVLGLPVGRFHGIGPATAAKMERLGIRTGADLRAQGAAFLTIHFGKAGRYYYDIARGVDHRQVRPDRIRKSLGSETTFAEDIHGSEAALAALMPLVRKVWDQAAHAGLHARTVTVKIRFADFHQITRARSLPRPLVSAGEMQHITSELIHAALPGPQGVRLLGVTLSGFEHLRVPEPDDQLDLFD